MRQGRMHVPASVALVCVGLVAMASIAALVGPRPAAAAKATTASTEARASRNAVRQFTGYVSAMDKTSLTVEKRGKKPTSKVFVRHDEMSVSGEVEKDARVTVYYRDDGGRAIAHRVVAKPAKNGSKSRS